MRWKWKLAMLMAMLGALLIVANWQNALLSLQYIYSTQWIWIIVGLIIIGGVALWIGPWLGLWSKLKLSRRFGDQRIPQWKRIEIAMNWIEAFTEARTASGGVLNLVDNYITPARDDARPIEMMLFTTSKSFAENRIDPRGIPESQRFYVFVDCISGECFSIAYMNALLTEEAVKFINRYWFMGIKQRVDTPMDRWVKEGFARATGEEIARKELKEEEKVEK